MPTKFVPTGLVPIDIARIETYVFEISSCDDSICETGEPIRLGIGRKPLVVVLVWTTAVCNPSYFPIMWILGFTIYNPGKFLFASLCNAM